MHFQKFWRRPRLHPRTQSYENHWSSMHFQQFWKHPHAAPHNHKPWISLEFHLFPCFGSTRAHTPQPKLWKMKGIVWNLFILEASAPPTPTVKLLKSCEFHTFSIALDASAILTAQTKTMKIFKKRIYIYIYIYIYCRLFWRHPRPLPHIPKPWKWIPYILCSSGNTRAGIPLPEEVEMLGMS